MHKTPIALISVCLLLPIAAMSDWRDETRTLMDQVAAVSAAPAGEDEAARFNSLVEASHDYFMLSYPEFATYRGDPRGRDRWTDNSPAAIAQRQADERALLAALQTIDRAALPPAQQVNLDLLLDRMRNAVADQQFPEDVLPLNQMSGPQQDIAQLMAITRPANAAEFEDMLARLEAVPELIEQDIARMRRGMQSGVTPPRITLRDVPQQVRNQLVDDPVDSPVLVAFQQFPASVDELQGERLRQRAQAAYSEQVAPAGSRVRQRSPTR